MTFSKASFHKYRGALFALVPATLAVAAIVGYLHHETQVAAERWESVRQRIKSEGFKLELSEFDVESLPAPETNFATTPLIRSCLDFEIINGSFVSNDIDSYRKLKGLRLPKFDWRKNPLGGPGEMPDIESIVSLLISEDRLPVPERGTSAERFIGAYSFYREELNELAEAANRPFSQMPVQFPRGFEEAIGRPTPWYQPIRDCCVFYKVLGSCYLISGDRENAISTLKVLHQLGNLFSSYPDISAVYLRASITGVIQRLISEGANLDVWTAADYRYFIDIFSDTGIFEHALNSLNQEMILMGIMGCDDMKKGNFFSNRGRDSIRAMSSSFVQYYDWLPDYFWDHNKAAFCELLLDRSLIPIRDQNFSHSKMPPVVETLKTIWVYFPGDIYYDCEFAVARFEAFCRLVCVSCAIELYRIENGNLPADLERLMPEYLDSIPVDVMAPADKIRYLIDPENGSYRVYSVGLNRVDDGGEPGWRRSGRLDHETGDWVWGNPIPKPPLAPDR